MKTVGHPSAKLLTVFSVEPTHDIYVALLDGTPHGRVGLFLFQIGEISQSHESS